ncbi:SRR1-domain-containing protein [Linnemannia elongata AG-77]|uniref:SRR1-domain-containing protein n=1 Tax=Linnemannia elongata AG-77 TaxID=1314771 RepID=A0A197JPH9_9FUNG|nr:SRR1-domain-containing protein [Linnemannia elongata AG-77]
MDIKDKELYSDMGLTTGTPVVQEEEEVFTFVSRKKNGRRQNGASVTTTTTTPPPPAASLSSRTISEEPKETSLPGWGSNRKPGKIKKNSQRAKMMGSRGVDQEERTLEWGQRLMDDRVMTLKQSKFYTAFQDLVQLTLCPPCKKQQQPSTHKDTQQRSSLTFNDTATHLESKSSQDKGLVVEQSQEDDPTQSDTTTADTPADDDFSRSDIVDMICYGIGSIESSRNAQFQLAMALCLKEILQLSGTVSIFDPVMTSYDCQLMEYLGMKVLTGDGRSRQPVEVKTLYYMPHCPKGLYSLILETNWSRQCLDNLAILGNRFTMYDESPSFRQVAKQAPFILPGLSIARISMLPTIKFEDNTVFNDLGFHCFPANQKLPDVDLTDREVDPELL